MLLLESKFPLTLLTLTDETVNDCRDVIMTYTFPGSQNDEDKRLKAFNEAVHNLLVSPDECGSVLPFIELRLRQCGLRHKYEPKDVFIEVYDGLVQEIRAGRDITDVPAAFKASTVGLLKRYRTRQ